MARKIKTKGENPLSDLEEKFLFFWFNNGFNAKQAYKLVRPNVTDNTAATEGSLTLIKPNVAKEIEIRKLEIKMKADIKTEDIVQHLKKMIDDCANDGDRTHMIKALEMLNKMAGNYVTKVQSENINHNVITWVEEKTYDSGSTNETE